MSSRFGSIRAYGSKQSVIFTVPLICHQSCLYAKHFVSKKKRIQRLIFVFSNSVLSSNISLNLFPRKTKRNFQSISMSTLIVENLLITMRTKWLSNSIKFNSRLHDRRRTDVKKVFALFLNVNRL